MTQSKAQCIREWLKANPRSTTAEIADAVNWTTQRVSATMWSELRRKPSEIIREERQDPGRTTPTYMYSHVATHAPTQAGAVHIQPEPGPVTLMPPRALGLDAVAKEMARAIAQHVLSHVESQLAEQLKHILPATTKPLTPISIEALTSQVFPVEHAGARRPTVLIAGLLPNQAGIIQQEFGEVFDLRFYMVDESIGRLRAMLRGVDHVFTFTSKISHAVEEVMKSEDKVIHRCSGGMTMLKQQLLDLYVKET